VGVVPSGSPVGIDGDNFPFAAAAREVKVAAAEVGVVAVVVEHCGLKEGQASGQGERTVDVEEGCYRGEEVVAGGSRTSGTYCANLGGFLLLVQSFYGSNSAAGVSAPAQRYLGISTHLM
jgi:hypothetical protein